MILRKIVKLHFSFLKSVHIVVRISLEKFMYACSGRDLKSLL